VVAQANWRDWRDDNERLLSYRANNSAFAFSDKLAGGIAAIQQRFGKRLPAQAAHSADVEVDDSTVLTLGGRVIELLSTPGGETTDSMVVWLPEHRICLCGNTFGPVFGHIPNLVTMRGDRYRDPLTTIASIERVRELRAEVLITGHFAPIRGADRINAELTRLRDAIAYLHDRTVEGMNAGKDVHTLMREITLPAELEVGQGYGKVSWDVRAIWENYSGWFHHRSTTELYDIGPDELNADFVDLAGSERVVERAEEHLAAGRPVHAIHLAEAVVKAESTHARARAVLRTAHKDLLGGSENFWESAWLRKKIGDYS
jgi:alkyl sulfatase BDS1-like metallo-beta-lactamase superfamily hydrolase